MSHLLTLTLILTLMLTLTLTLILTLMLTLTLTPRSRGVADESVGEVAGIYLGNILYAMELAAMSLDEQGKGSDAAFYRGIARKLAEAHGRAVTRAQAPPDQSPPERSGAPDSSS
jgi:hypothetical protein